MSITATVEQLEGIYGQPNEASTVKVSAKISPPYRALIDKSPFAALATCGPEGRRAAICPVLFAFTMKRR